MKDLSLINVARLAKVNYSVASQVLLGRRIDQKALDAIKRVVNEACVPEEAAK